MEELASCAVDGVATSEVHAILDDADLVKFAKLIPSADDAMGLVVRVREIVLATWVEEAEPEPVAEAAPAWPAEVEARGAHSESPSVAALPESVSQLSPPEANASEGSGPLEGDEP